MIEFLSALPLVFQIVVGIGVLLVLYGLVVATLLVLASNATKRTVRDLHQRRW